MLKYLRLAVTALSLTACVLLIALWVRSYYRLDTVGAWRGHTVSSMKGRLFVDGEFGYVESAESWQVFRFYPGTSVPIGANWKSYTRGTPIWFITLLTAIAAAVPWLHYRFSLRTLLIATTLVAVGLGVIAISG